MLKHQTENSMCGNHFEVEGMFDIGYRYLPSWTQAPRVLSQHIDLKPDSEIVFQKLSSNLNISCFDMQ